MGTVIEQTTYETLEAGMYPVTVAAVEGVTGEYGPQVKVKFTLQDTEDDARFLLAWASAKLSGGKRPSKLYQWTQALLFGGKGIPEGFALDIDTLVGKAALAVVDVVERDGVERNKIAQLLPLRPAKAAVRPGPVKVNSQASEPATAPGWMNDAGDGVEESPF